MLDNLKFALTRHNKFLAIFFVVIFLPSLVLAVFGIRAIRNERFKLQQRNLDLQREFLTDIKSEIRSFIDQKSANLKNLASSHAFQERDFRAIRNTVSLGLRSESLLGEIVIWSVDGPPWLPSFQERPPADVVFTVPDEWRTWGPELKEAEELEFRRREYSGAAALYRRLLPRARDRRIEAWILSRIARCEVKLKNYGRAVAVYRSIVKDHPGQFTESGRPLELVSRLAILDALLSNDDKKMFLEESLTTYARMQNNPWSLDGPSFQSYSDILKEKIGDALAADASVPLPGGYLAAVADHQELIEAKLSAWRLARAVETDILSGSVRATGNQENDGIPVQQRAFEFEEQDVLVLAAPIGWADSSPGAEFLGTLLRMEHLRGFVDSLMTRADFPGAAVLVRSSLTDRILFGEEFLYNLEIKPVLSDVFQGYFLPWRLELYPVGQPIPETPLYRNIFFWIILALLVILFIGSGLIIRTIVQEANLLKLKSDFIASVSHEFKTPLTAMGAILERLLSGDVIDPKRTREYFWILRHDSDRLKRLVKNVLDFSKIEDGKRDYRLRQADIVQLVKREIRSFEKESGIEGLTVGFQADDGVPSVPVDEEALSQALHNILDNAAKFSPGETKIDVEVRKRRGAVEIVVQDRGIGIPENELKKIFEKFYRGKQAASVSPTGTGLGLSLVKHIVDAHEGNVLVQSRPGEGCRMSLILPADRGDR